MAYQTCKRLVMFHLKTCDFCEDREFETDQVRIPDHHPYGWQVCANKYCQDAVEQSFLHTVMTPESVQKLLPLQFRVLRTSGEWDTDWILGHAVKYNDRHGFIAVLKTKDGQYKKEVPLTNLIQWNS